MVVDCGRRAGSGMGSTGRWTGSVDPDSQTGEGLGRLDRPIPFVGGERWVPRRRVWLRARPGGGGGDLPIGSWGPIRAIRSCTNGHLHEIEARRTVRCILLSDGDSHRLAQCDIVKAEAGPYIFFAKKGLSSDCVICWSHSLRCRARCCEAGTLMARGNCCVSVSSVCFMTQSGRDGRGRVAHPAHCCEDRWVHCQERGSCGWMLSAIRSRLTLANAFPIRGKLFPLYPKASNDTRILPSLPLITKGS